MVSLPFRKDNIESVLFTQHGFLYKENHSLYEWFKIAYGDEQEYPATITERSANNSMVHNSDSLSWE